MTRAFSESYLSNAKNCLAAYFDYTINNCDFMADWAAQLFVSTGIAEQFERGNPSYLAGMSGIEVAQQVIMKAYANRKQPAYTTSEDRSPEYWAGWTLAEYQWFTSRRYKDIFERIPLSRVIDMYSVYHEMDISSFIETMEELYKSTQRDTKLKQIRESRGFSQADLAQRSGVHIRNIQAYEQRDNDIDRAQAKILYKLSRALGCEVEDLLEEPMQ